MQSMLSILEWRHRLLHMRACLKRKWPIEVSLNIHWTFFQFQNTSSRREDLMATDKGNFQKKNIIWSKIWKKMQEEIHRDPWSFLARTCFSVNEWSKNNRDEDVCRARDVLADEDHTYHLSESEYFNYWQKLVDHSQYYSARNQFERFRGFWN